jgi:hypothetical protein
MEMLKEKLCLCKEEKEIKDKKKYRNFKKNDN